MLEDVEADDGLLDRLNELNAEVPRVRGAQGVRGGAGRAGGAVGRLSPAVATEAVPRAECPFPPEAPSEPPPRA